MDPIFNQPQFVLDVSHLRDGSCHIGTVTFISVVTRVVISTSQHQERRRLERLFLINLIRYSILDSHVQSCKLQKPSKDGDPIEVNM